MAQRTEVQMTRFILSNDVFFYGPVLSIELLIDNFMFDKIHLRYISFL